MYTPRRKLLARVHMDASRVKASRTCVRQVCVRPCAHVVVDVVHVASTLASHVTV